MHADGWVIALFDKVVSCAKIVVLTIKYIEQYV